MNIAVMPFAEWAPLLFTPDMNPPRFDTWRAEHQLGVRPHHALDHGVRDHRLGDDALAARVQHVHLRALLVGREVRLEEVVLDARVVGHDPLAGGLRRLARQVLARCVAGRVVEAREQHAAGAVLLDLDQAARACRFLGGRLDLVEVLAQPEAELARLARALEQERRRALHAVVQDRGRHAAALVEQAHAAVVRSDERALGCRQRNVELALRVLAVHEQRPRQADRYLRDTEELLDVAGQSRRVERVVRHVLQLGARHLLDEIGTRLLRLARVVVLPVAGDRDSLAQKITA
jgi:hypothetical protein